MATTKQADASTPDLTALHPDPLTPTSESVERYIAALQLAFRESAADDGEQQSWIKRQAWTQLRLARAREAARAAEVLDTLNRVFRLGTPPEIDGFKPGMALGFAGLGPLNGPARALLGRWHPWLGKSWSANSQTGVNIITGGSLRLLRPVIPGGQAELRADGSFAAVPFKTWIGPGAMDPDREVLKIDYAIPENKPAVRTILDEQVEIVPDVYLGKALMKVRGKYRFLLFFANCSPEVSEIG